MSASIILAYIDLDPSLFDVSTTDYSLTFRIKDAEYTLEIISFLMNDEIQVGLLRHFALDVIEHLIDNGICFRYIS